MTKIYPNSPSAAPPPGTAAAASEDISSGEPTVLTVWRKSLLFNCSGFTVFDSKGSLVFRVDNYAAGSRSEAVLMDGAGEPLFTVRRKRLSLGDHWLVYDGEETKNPRLSVFRKQLAQFLRNQPSKSKTQARVVSCAAGSASGEGFSVEGSYSGRSCAVYDAARRQLVAEITKKEAAGGIGLGNDVFRLVVQPGLDTPLAMAVVLALEQMFGSRSH